MTRAVRSALPHARFWVIASSTRVRAAGAVICATLAMPMASVSAAHAQFAPPKRSSAAPAAADKPAEPSVYAVIPRPVVLTPQSGRFTLTARTAIYADAALLPVGRRFARDIANATGFDVALGAQQSAQTLVLMRLCDVLVPLITSGIAIWVIASYPITEEKAHEVRKALEARRGAAGAAVAATAG